MLAIVAVVGVWPGAAEAGLFDRNVRRDTIRADAHAPQIMAQTNANLSVPSTDFTKITPPDTKRKGGATGGSGRRGSRRGMPTGNS